MYPALPAPFGERLTGIDTKTVQAGFGLFRRKSGPGEPATRKFTLAVGHVFAAENTQAQHLWRRKLWAEVWIKIASSRCDENVSIAPLHSIVDDDVSLLHPTPEFMSSGPKKLLRQAGRNSGEPA